MRKQLFYIASIACFGCSDASIPEQAFEGQGLPEEGEGLGTHDLELEGPDLLTEKAAVAAEWVELDAMQNPRFEASAFQYKDDLYVFNGFGPGIDLEPTLERLDAGSFDWDSPVNTNVLGTSVTHNGVVVVDDEVWVIGGREGNHPGAVVDRVWIYDIDSNDWSEGPSLPVPVAAGGAALYNNKIHWIGGLDPQAKCDADHHFVYNLGKPGAGWQDITDDAAMPKARNHFATVVLNGKIYTIGGQFGHDNGCPGLSAKDTNLVHAYNPVSMTWTQKASLPHINSHSEPGTFAHAGAIYVVGGATEGGLVMRYNPTNDEWVELADLPQNLLAPAARVMDDKLVVASGGQNITATRYTDMDPLTLPEDEQSRVVRLVKRNQPFAMDGKNGATNGQSVHLWHNQGSNVNQLWVEIPRGNGFYSYQKYGTEHCLDGNRGGADGQDLYLWDCGSNNRNQHWKKITVTGSFVRLQKRNASGYSIDGNKGGALRQNVYLWTSKHSNINQHWSLTEADVD